MAQNIPINSQLVRRNNADFPLVDDTDLGGGLRVVTDIPARDAIAILTPSQLKVGMRVVVQAPSPPQLYRLAQITPSVVWSAGESASLEFATFAAFPLPASVPGQFAWAQDTNSLYLSAEGVWQPITQGGPVLTPLQHETLYQLIHFIDDGPATGFLTGAFKETLPLASPFPTSETWWESAAKLKKIVEKLITRNPNQTPSTTQWKMYDSAGVLLSTVTDTISYSGVFETSRTRAII